MTPHYTALLDGQEGSRLVVYDDATGKPIVKGSIVKGHPTIGIGRALDSSNGISKIEQNVLFADDVGACEAKLEAAFIGFSKLSEGRQFVLVDIAFNCGFAGLMGFPAMLRAVWAGQWAVASAECLNSDAARQLQSRYKLLAYILRNGSDTGYVA